MYYVTFYIPEHPVPQYLYWAACVGKQWSLGHTDRASAAARFETHDEAEREARKFLADYPNPNFQVVKC